MKQVLLIPVFFLLMTANGFSQTFQFTMKALTPTTFEVYVRPSATTAPVTTGITNLTFVLQVPQTYPNPQGSWTVVPNATYLGAVSTNTGTSTANGAMYNTFFSWTSNANIAGTAFVGGTEYLMATITIPPGVLGSTVTLTDWGNNRLNNAPTGAPLWATSISLDGVDRTNNTAIFYSSTTTLAPVNSGDVTLQSSLNFNGPLAVQLLNFSGRLTGASAQLNWSAANEKELSTYEVQYSVDAAAWLPAATVKADHADNGTHEYKLTHTPAGMEDEVYYRLKMVGYNGSESYSKVVRLSWDGNAGTDVKIYPTKLKAGELVYIDMPKEVTGVKGITVTDVNGRMVQQLPAASGKNYTLRTYDLNSGVYYLRVVSNNNITTVQTIMIL